MKARTARQRQKTEQCLITLVVWLLLCTKWPRSFIQDKPHFGLPRRCPFDRHGLRILLQGVLAPLMQVFLHWFYVAYFSNLQTVHRSWELKCKNLNYSGRIKMLVPDCVLWRTNLSVAYVSTPRRRLSKLEESSNAADKWILLFPWFEGQVWWILLAPAYPMMHCSNRIFILLVMTDELREKKYSSK